MAVVPAVFRLVRLNNVLVSFAGTIVAGLAAVGLGVPTSWAFWFVIVLAGLSTACVTAAGNVLNDVLDVEGDRVNHPDRPIVRGEWTVSEASMLCTGLFAAGGLFIVPLLNFAPLLGVIYLVAVGALLGYEYRLKARGFTGNGLVALLTGLVFLYGGTAVGDPLTAVPFAVMAFLATLSREITKDIEDMGGDVGRHTLPMTRGVPFAVAASRASVAAAIVASAVPLLWFVPLGSVGGIMYLAFVAAADAVFVLSVAYLPRRLHWEQTMSKVAMAVALVAFLVVAFR